MELPDAQVAAEQLMFDFGEDGENEVITYIYIPLTTNELADWLMFCDEHNISDWHGWMKVKMLEMMVQ